MPRLISLFFAAVLLAASPAFAADWNRAQSDHFIVYSTGDAKGLEKYTRDLERFHRLVWNLVSRNERREQWRRLTIYILPNIDSVQRLVGPKRSGTAGFYRASKYGSFAVANRENSDATELDGRSVLFHEYAHHLMFSLTSFAFPTWSIEGFAEYHSTVEFDSKGLWTLGKPPRFRANGLLLTEGVPIEHLLFEGLNKLDLEERDRFYGLSWALVHMMNHDPTRAGQMSSYLAALASGKPEREAAQQSFGDLAKLETDLNRYIKRGIAYAKGHNPIEYTGPIELTKLDPVESRLTDLRLGLISGGDPERVRKELQAFTSSNPGSPDGWTLLARADWQAFMRTIIGRERPDQVRLEAAVAASEASLDRALALDPAHGGANLLKGELLTEKLSLRNETAPEAWRGVRRYLRAANAADPTDPAALHAWYQSFVRQGLTPPQNAIDGLTLAFSLAPEAADIRIALAFELARQKRFEEAISLIELLVRDPHDTGNGSALLERLKAMRDAEQQGEEQPND